MKGRVDIVQKELESHNWPEYLHRVDTLRLTIQQTITKIVDTMSRVQLARRRRLWVELLRIGAVLAGGYLLMRWLLL